MLVGAGMGRWQFTFRALRCLMAKPAAEMTFAVKSCSGAKLHWHIIIMRVGYMNRNGYRVVMIALFVDNASLGKRGINLLSHLHSCLHIDGLLCMNPGLYVTLQTIEKTKQGFSIINIYTLSIAFGKPYNIVCKRPSLGQF